MGTSELRIDASGLAKLASVVRALGEEEDELPVKLRRVIEEAAVELAKKASAKALAEPTHGIKHTGLRDQVARGVAVQPRPEGVRITTSMPLPDEAAIPRGMDELRGWRHPVFGHRDRWVTQHAAFSWFMDTMQEGGDEIQDKLTRALEEAARRIADAAHA